MTYTFSVNNSPTTGAMAMYALVSTLISAGWLKKMDSDGTTYSSTGVQVTSGNVGTNGLGNANAWVRLQSPAVNGGSVVNQTREITIQRGSSNLLWRIKYSASALFTGGSPAAAVTPSSADEVFMIGGGTDASPTFYSWLAADGAYRWHIAAGGAAEFYSFVAWAQTIGSVTGTLTICLDVMATGSFPVIDVDPAVMYCSTTNNTILEQISNSFVGTNQTNPARARAWLGATSAAGASLTSNNVIVGITNYASSTLGGLTFATNPWTNKDDLFPCLWGCGNTTLPRGVKGISTLFKFGSIQRLNGEPGASITTKDKIFFGSLWFPWSGVAPLI